jgi:hypothetical protein
MSNGLFLVKPQARLRVKKLGAVWCVWWEYVSLADRNMRWYKRWESVEKHVRDELRIAKRSAIGNVMAFPARQMSLYAN